MEKMKLTNICTPKQWKTIPTSQLLSNGYPVYGANGIIGYYKTYNHEQSVIAITCRGASCGTINITRPQSYITVNAMCLDNVREDINLKYLYYNLLSFDFNKVISGSAQPQITRQGLEKVEISICPPTEQISIVSILTSIESLILARKKELNYLDELVKARFVEMFGDPSSPGEKYKIAKLGTVADVKSSHRVFTNEFVEEGIPFYRGTEISSLATGQIPEVPYRISMDHYLKLVCDDSKPLRGDLLIPSICNKGQVWMVNTDDPFYYKDGRVLCISPNRSIFDSKYLQFYLKMRTEFEYPKLGSGSTFAEFKIFQLKDMVVDIPPIDIQRFFTLFV